MFSKWNLTTLDKLGKISKGIQKHKPNFDPSLFEDGKIPLVGCKEVSESNLRILSCDRHYNSKGLSQSKLFPKNTVCIVEGGNSSTDTAILKYSSCLSADLHGFNSFEGISDPRFIKYCFDYPKMKEKLMKLAKSTTAQPHLTLSRLLSVKFPCPPRKSKRELETLSRLTMN
ncbi:restriction endonuclease subunit S [Mycoplasma suis]|uniref:restriction endonuclease subunit S n=1 Tax=Mycoplasma suis TaxID=57372 RepID=UPI0009DA4BA1|nr:restriction endonuclease subunit S [Mycoplasma suis]